MKLLLLPLAPLPILPNPGGVPLSPSLPNSVCNHKKTSLSGWLPLPPAYLPAPHRSGLPSNSSFLTPPLTPLAYSNSK